jgi:hypothetical protein
MEVFKEKLKIGMIMLTRMSGNTECRMQCVDQLNNFI